MQVDKAIKWLEAELEKMRAEPRGQLTEMDSDTAMEMGYQMCITNLEGIYEGRIKV